MDRLSVALLFAALAWPLPSANAAEETKPHGRIKPDAKWLCYFGEDRDVLNVSGYDLLILESEAIGKLSSEAKKGRTAIAYMSVGEVSANRWYWTDVKGKPWVLHANPEWPEDRLVDPRAPEWRELVVEEIAPVLVELGYDGFFLDNVDTAEHLEKEDGEKYEGAEEAMKDLIRSLRARFPDAVIVANGGFSIVPFVAGELDAMLCEGTVSTWRHREGGDGFDYAPIDDKAETWLLPRLRRVKRTGLPILALEYVDPNDAAEMERVRGEVIKAGNNPYLSTRELDTFPGSDRLPPRPRDD